MHNGTPRRDVDTGTARHGTAAVTASSPDQSSKEVCLQVTARKMSTRLYCTLKNWMEDICLPLTLPRKVFLRRFDALLTLRGFSSVDFRSVQSAMEVLLRFRKDPRKQTRY